MLRECMQVPMLLTVVIVCLCATQDATTKVRGMQNDGSAICAQVPVLLAVDRYNALYAPAEYGQSVGDYGRRLLDPGELRLAAALRLTEHAPPANGASVVAMARGDRVARATRVRAPARTCLHAHAAPPLPFLLTAERCATASHAPPGRARACMCAAACKQAPSLFSACACAHLPACARTLLCPPHG
jgi:hypothetical protein